MAPRKRTFPDSSARFEHFLPDDGAEYARYVALNPAHDFDSRDARGREELQKVFFDRDGKPRENDNQVVQLANLFQASIRTRLAQIAGNRAWSRSRAGGKTDFAASPRTFWKTAQEMLTAPADRVLISRSMTAQQVLAALVVDARLITPVLLRNLGIADPVDEKGLPLEDQLTLRARAIPDVKSALTHLEPIRRPDEAEATLGDLHYFRMMRVSAGEREGMVVGTQTIGGQKILFSTDLRGAERRIHHIRHNYEEEIEKLTWIQGVIQNLRDHLAFWKNPERRADLEQLFATMVQIVDSLEHVEDDNKRKLLKQLEACTDVNDSRGRPNPSSKPSQLKKALEFLGLRLRSIESISKYIGEDHVKVLEVLAAQKDPLEGVRERIQVKMPWDVQVQEFRNSMEGVHYQPDLGFAQQAQTHVDQINEGLATGQRRAARKEYVDLYVLCKMKEAYDSIWDIYRRISIQPEQQDPRKILNELLAIEGKLRDKSFSSDFETEAYYDAYGKMYHLINSLKKRLNELLNPDSVQPLSEEEVASENKTLLGLLQGLQGQSEVLDRLLATVKAKPQQNMLDLLRAQEEVDPERKRETFKLMKARIAEMDLQAFVCPER
ncbi:MAG: hypothetical protein WC777_03980 [Candidatus Gracilibacteria bacterium]|jgi:hypothetical protein